MPNGLDTPASSGGPRGTLAFAFLGSTPTLGAFPPLLREGRMRAVTRVVVSCVGLACLAATTAWAQHPQTRQGFWIGFGFGYGSLGLSCDGCNSIDREGGVSGYVK